MPVDLNDPTAVEKALDQHYARKHPHRGDEQYLHVTDLGGCDRETWARRRFFRLGYVTRLRHTGEKPEYLPDFDGDTHRKFDFGFHVEHETVDGLDAVERPILTGLKTAIRATLDGVEGRIVAEAYVPAGDELLGHPDGVAPETMLEVKSTEFHLDRKTWERIVPDLPLVKEKSKHYLLQGSAYGLAFNKPYGLLIIECRTSGKVAVVPFNPLDYEADVLARIFVAVEVTAQERMPEPSLGAWTFNNGKSWLCKYCRFIGCEFNRRAS